MTRNVNAQDMLYPYTALIVPSFSGLSDNCAHKMAGVCELYIRHKWVRLSSYDRHTNRCIALSLLPRVPVYIYHVPLMTFRGHFTVTIVEMAYIFLMVQDRRMVSL